MVVFYMLKEGGSLVGSRYYVYINSSMQNRTAHGPMGVFCYIYGFQLEQYRKTIATNICMEGIKKDLEVNAS